MDAITKRSALKAVSMHKRRQWALANPSTCSTCVKYGNRWKDSCAYPSHLSGERLDKAFADLCSAEDVAKAQQAAVASKASILDRTFGEDGKLTDNRDGTFTRETVETPPAPAQVAAPAAPSVDAGDDLARALRAAMAAQAPALDESAVKAIVKDMLAADNESRVKRLEVTIKRDGESKKIDVGVAHRQFPQLLKMINAGVNVWIAGPAGSGKTHAVEQAARALGLPFYFNGAIDTEYKLSGFVDAGGRIISTPFRRAFTDGGVYLFDEIDASMPAALLAFNAALANGAGDFPGQEQPITRHPDFRCVAGANTFGHGATTEYVGRAKMDAAFLDRFSFLEWGYDESLERALSLDPEWTSYVQKLRAIAKNRGLKVVISPRASIRGGQLLAAGVSRSAVVEAEIKNKIGADAFKALEGEI